MLIATLVTIAKEWSQPRCPLTDRCVSKMWDVYASELYSAIKRNEVMAFEGK